ncbi:MAG TPA: hemolysin III family protein [Pyrinomonadaceae bacterium]|nr:hemolysin III family protein [Pyrinomonadaceae bacterium]
MSTQAKERLPLEEVANCATHGVGLALSVAGFVALVALAWAYGDAWHVTSCGVYGASLVALYLASTLYHGARAPRAKQLFRALDHCGIYLLIAGTYTPFTLVTLRGPWGWTLFGLVWGLALAGILFRVLCGERHRPLAVASYVLLGWLCVVAVKPILEIVPLGALAWIAAGGLAYTAGVFFFAAKRIPHNHAIWHLFVLGGSICHYVAVLLYVLPARG